MSDTFPGAEAMTYNLLSYSMQHLNDATDPDTPEILFRPYLRIGALAGQLAEALAAIAEHVPDQVEAIAAKIFELASDGEVLISVVGEALNSWDHGPDDSELDPHKAAIA